MKGYKVPICSTVKIPVHAHFKPIIEMGNDAVFASAKACGGKSLSSTRLPDAQRHTHMAIQRVVVDSVKMTRTDTP